MPIVKVNEGTSSEYTRIEISEGTIEEVRLGPITGLSEENDAIKFYTAKFRFSGVSLLKENLPLSINPREPGSSKAVTKMRDTLKDKSACKMFHLYNSGMAIIAESVKFEKKGKDTFAVLSFKIREQGLCNGGHTYFAIKRAFAEKQISSDFFVNCEVIILPATFTLEQKVKWSMLFAKARNFSEGLAQTSLADGLGYFDKIKQLLGQNSTLVEYHENDSDAVEGAVSTKLLLRNLAALDPYIFAHATLNPSGTMTHQAAARTDDSKVWKPWLQQNEQSQSVDLERIYPLALDMLKLRDKMSRMISHEAVNLGAQSWKKSKFFKDWVTSKGKTRAPLFSEFGDQVQDIPPTLETILLGNLRCLVTYLKDSKGEPTFVGWSYDPFRMITSQDSSGMSEFMRSLNQMATGFIGEDSVGFTKSPGPYTQILTWNPNAGFNPPSIPEIVYRISDGKKFTKSEDGSGEFDFDAATGDMIPNDSGSGLYHEV